MRPIRAVCPCCGQKIEISIDLEPVVTAAAPEDGKTDMSFCDQVEDIDFRDKNFCFTGKFENADRASLEDLVHFQGGLHFDTMTSAIDYLVVGSRVSKGWRNGSYGAKIDAAMQLKQQGHGIRIVSEQDFLRILREKYEAVKAALNETEKE